MSADSHIKGSAAVFRSFLYMMCCVRLFCHPYIRKSEQHFLTAVIEYGVGLMIVF
jgi:hypothetical protein